MTKGNKLRDTSRVLWGTVLLLIGSALLLGNLDVIELGSVWEYWPFIPVAIGIGKLVVARDRKDWGEGIWWIFIGVWLYISVFEIYGLGFRESWPLLLVAWGISMVWNSLTGHLGRSRVSAGWQAVEEPHPSKGEST